MQSLAEYVYQRRSSNFKAALRSSPGLETAPASQSIQPLANFDWTKQEPLNPRPFKPVYHITMGVRVVDPADLILIDKSYLTNIHLRRQILSKHGATVHGAIPSGDAAVRELYAYLLQDYLPSRYPSMFRLSGDGKMFQNLVTGKAFPATAPPDVTSALRILAETIEDDWFVLQETPEGHRSVAFVCCFASGFDPSAKLGKGLKEIHAPVPSYEKIGPSMERFFSKLEVGKGVKRNNWAIQTHSEICDVKGHLTEEDDTSEQTNVDIDQTHFRTELQSLTRLPRTKAILFSFKTYLTPLSGIREEGLGPQLADAIEGLKTGNAPGMWTYKGSIRWAPRVCEYLRS
ncbi:hypothetical protein S7711_04739 [Stachybotrys chartarum IBT 7711]|uniref:Uncharacterized protein n=1 Tax=Stachybotrys chartarum (strain CBS 109288 / IBT 7711) TaxID=1280523 RepID=A0A084AP38_STACB|nr:hypothetical protein S7711_04739 [Stachybotrys chartarum IBT 7711]